MFLLWAGGCSAGLSRLVNETRLCMAVVVGEKDMVVRASPHWCPLPTAHCPLPAFVLESKLVGYYDFR